MKITILFVCMNAIRSDFVRDKLPEFRIDLNAPPDSRFGEPHIYFKEKIKVRTEAILKMIPIMDQILLYLFESVIGYVQPIYYQEIKALSLITEIPTYKLLAVDYINEELSACTSMCVKHPSGYVMHGRNLDTPWLRILRDTTYIAHFYRGDKYVFDSVIFAGFTGIYTGIKKGLFSISIDLRRLDGQGPLFKNIINVLRGLKQDSWLLREVLENSNSYLEAVYNVSFTKSAATDYFIICGLDGNQGTVITKNRDELVNRRDLTTDDWYLVQTNKDHFEEIFDNRYKAAVKRLDEIGRESINEDRLRNEVMLVIYPAQYDTVYTTTMIPFFGLFDAIKTTVIE